MCNIDDNVDDIYSVTCQYSIINNNTIVVYNLLIIIVGIKFITS